MKVEVSQTLRIGTKMMGGTKCFKRFALGVSIIDQMWDMSSDKTMRLFTSTSNLDAQRGLNE